MYRLAVPATVLGFVVASCGEPATPSRVTSRAPIVGGQRTSDYPASVALVVEAHGGTWPFCSGTLIAPRHVLTAAHCIALSGLPPRYISVYFGDNVYGGSGTTRAVRNATLHPSYDEQQLDHDIAVLELTADAPVTPAPMPPAELDRRDVGRPLTLVGFGIDNVQTETGSGLKRSTTLPLFEIDGTHLYYRGRTRGSCQGDSGGSSYLSFDGIDALVGVTSFGSEDCVSLGADTRVDAYRDFIDGRIPSDDQGPTLTVTSPRDGELVPPDFTVRAEASDVSGVLEIRVEGGDGTRLATSRSSPAELPVRLAPGRHRLMVRATDTRWNRTETPLSIIVQCNTDADCGPGRLCGDHVCFDPAPIGGPCTAASQCAHGLCAPGDDGVSVCTRGCAATAECPPGYECAGGACLRRLALSPGAVGAPCAADTQCTSGICAEADTGRGFCTLPCDPSTPCPNGSSCSAPAGSAGFCGAPPLPRRAGSGCAAAGTGVPGATVLGLAGLLALLLARRPGRSASARP